MFLLTIDPGVSTGWAIYNVASKTLVECGEDAWPNYYFDRVIIERPVFDKRTKDPESIAQLLLRVGEYKGMLLAKNTARVELVRPATWKGSVPKETHQEYHIWPKLHPMEENVVNHCANKFTRRKYAKHPFERIPDVMDAVGIGLWALNRQPWRSVSRI